ncbi:MAG: DUF2207 domain-containing protein [Clostridiales bacterium]|nr:DUF2207 domain-containing protein [Clostridiales bacterium]
MNDMKYKAYEYSEITVKRSMESVYVDNLENFGWTLEGVSTPVGKIDSITLECKRDRKIPNKVELTRLQRQFEAQVNEIVTLEQSKVVKASAVAYVLGVIGTAFMAGSVFAVTAAPPMIVLCIILAVPGFLGWVFPYFCFRSISKRKTEELIPIIDAKYDALYEVCEKANQLII